VLPARARGRPILNPANLAPLAAAKNVVVIHDAAALRNPSWYSRLYATWQARVLPAVATRATHVVTVSEFSKHEIVELLHIRPDKVTVIPGGVGEQFTPDAPRPPGFDRPYVLCVASATARKNLAALVPAAQQLGTEIVVAGGGRPQFAEEQGLDALTLLGHVDEHDLPGLYAGAQAFVLPSLHEGFGLTALEAMACGTPVVATRAGALPETCGDAALLTDPDNLTESLKTVLNDHPTRTRLIEAGTRRAAQFTWDATARAVDALLASA
jgi:glycosyltransferase involved in cell wall biosynthesis